ncbi:hypothetical protein [Streptomyces sp. sk2.1]|uniref:hypothetical protein n=1 Tax=Streptomyces sp. sk2.1 TaxID=2478959 RepID=UPI00165313D8|nr:hypothetical protein [Streptomyces sp. sk2.1]
MPANELSVIVILSVFAGSLAAIIGLAAGALLAEAWNKKKGPCQRCSSPAPDRIVP